MGKAGFLRKFRGIFLFAAAVFAAPCAGRTITVDANGIDDYPNIQAAIDDANNGDTVEIQPGRYTGPGNRDIDFKGKALTVRSEDPNNSHAVAATIIDCSGTVDDPHRGFYFHSGEDANSVLEGFTIINGYGPNEPFGASEYSIGGAVYCSNSSATIRKCIIRDNYADYCGGGLWFSNSRSLVEDCTFQQNDSDYTSGGLYNRLAGITVKNCRFIGNSAPAGGGMYNVDGGPTIRNTIFIGNLASLKGGAVCNNRAIVTLANCTFFNNQAPEGGAIDNRDSQNAIVKNSIVWDNSATEIEGPAQVTYCDVKGGSPGEGNIDTDPCFAKPGCWAANGTPDDANDDFWVDGDYHLKSQAGRWDANEGRWVTDDVTSPCIDAGDPMSPIGLQPFPNGGIINMGAYGGTGEASKSYFGGPPCETIVAGDVNGDCLIDFKDFFFVALHWLEDHN